MSRWHIDETREHIRRLFGREQLELANPCIRSVVDRQIYARIHFQDARAKIDAYIQAELQDASLLDVTLGGDAEAWAEFNIFIREAGAHLTACVQSIHSVPDILSHAVYYSLGLNRTAGALKARDIGVANILKLLKRETEFVGISSLLETYVRDESFRHLSALANQAKHKSIVFPSLNEDWTGERPKLHVVVFPAFSYDEVVYPQVQADELLSCEYERCSKLVVNTGIELNALLQGRMP